MCRIQSAVTPAYYSAIPPSSVPPYEPLPPDPGPLYCGMVEATAGTHMAPPPQHIVSHTEVELVVCVPCVNVSYYTCYYSAAKFMHRKPTTE